MHGCDAGAAKAPVRPRSWHGVVWCRARTVIPLCVVPSATQPGVEVNWPARCLSALC